MSTEINRNNITQIRMVFERLLGRLFRLAFGFSTKEGLFVLLTVWLPLSIGLTDESDAFRVCSFAEKKRADWQNDKNVCDRG